MEKNNMGEIRKGEPLFQAEIFYNENIKNPQDLAEIASFAKTLGAVKEYEDISARTESKNVMIYIMLGAQNMLHFKREVLMRFSRECGGLVEKINLTKFGDKEIPVELDSGEERLVDSYGFPVPKSVGDYF